MELDTLDLEIVRRLTRDRGSQGDTDPALARLLITDVLTGLYNRTYFQERLKWELATVSPDSPLALLVIDVDRFKQFNDRYGHRVGDLVLQQMAQALRAVCPPRAVACRLGGDEFVLVVPGISPERTDLFIAELLQEVARRPVSTGEGKEQVNPTASIGLAVAPRDGADPETMFLAADVAMYEYKRRGSGSRIARDRPGQDSAPLVGRNEQIAEAIRRLDQVETGAGSLLFLSGAPGVGKSRLGIEVARLAKRRGFLTVESALDSSELGPLSAVRQVVSSLLGIVGHRRASQLARHRWPVRLLLTLVQLGHYSTGQERPGYEQIAEGIRLLMAKAAAQQPVLWLLDDVRMADTSTLTILEHLAASIRELRVMLVGVARTKAISEAERLAVSSWWERLAQWDNCHRWDVQPLGRKAATELARWAWSWSGFVKQEKVDLLPEVGDGNPLLILRLATAPQGIAMDSTERVDLGRVYTVQIEALPGLTRTVLSAAAVLGYETFMSILVQVAPESPEGVRQAVDDLLAGGWLTREGPRLRFTHPLGQETAYKLIAPEWRRSLHRLAGHALIQERGRPSALAHHFDEGEDWTRAQAWHRQAGETAETSYAYAEAAAHYRRSLRLGEVTGQMPEDASALALRAAELFIKVEDYTPALEALQFALQRTTDNLERGQALILLAYDVYCFYMARYDLFLSTITEATRILRPLGPSEALARGLAYKIPAELIFCRQDEVEATAREAVVVVAGLGDPAFQVRWIAAISCWLTGAGMPDLSYQCFEKAEAVLRGMSRQQTPATAWALTMMTQAAVRLARLRKASYWGRQAKRLATQLGDVQLMLDTAEAEVRTLLLSGDVSAAERSVEEGKAVLRRSSAFRRQSVWIDLQMRAALYRHDLDRVEEHAAHLHKVSRKLDPVYALYGSVMQELTRLMRGMRPDPEQWSLDQFLPVPHRVQVTAPALAIGGQILLAAGKPDEAQVLIDAARERVYVVYDLPCVEWVQASIHLSGGRTDEAKAALRKVLELSGNAYYEALAHRDLAALLMLSGKAHRRLQAGTCLKKARRLFARMDNHYELEHVAEMEHRLAQPQGTELRQIPGGW